MSTRVIGSAAVLLAVVATMSPAAAQAPVANSQQVVPAAAAVFTGAFGFNFVINVVPTIPNDYPITCTATVSPVDVSALFTSETKAVVAVRNGNTATCSFAIHYAWTLSGGSTMVNTTYTVSALPSNPTGAAGSLVDRISAANLPSIALPPNGGSASRVVNVTL